MKLFSNTSPRTALEELEMEKLAERMEESEGNSDFDDLFEATQTAVKEDENKPKVEEQQAPDPDVGGLPANDPVDASAGSDSTRISGDSEAPPPANVEKPADASEDQDKEEEEPDDIDEAVEATKEEVLGPDPKLPVVSTEQFRTFMGDHMLGVTGFSMEAYIDSGGVSIFGRVTPEEREQGWERAKTATQWLKELGIKLSTQTLPYLAGKIYRGIVYAFDRLGYSTMVAMTTLERYLHRRINSFSNLHKNIKKAEEALALLTNNRAVEIEGQDGFKHKHSIEQIVSGDSIDLQKNLKTLSGFLETTVHGLGDSVKADIDSIRQLVTYSKNKGNFDVLSLMEVHLKLQGMSAGTIQGFETPAADLQTLHSNTLLPGNVRLLAHIPSQATRTREEWALAYRNSDIFLGVDRRSFKTIDEIPFKSVPELLKLLKDLEAFCNVCIKHQSFYEGLSKDKLSLKALYKNYFDDLTDRATKISAKEALIDLVALKNNFIDKVYLPAAIDLHDYSVRVINGYLKYVEKNIKALTP